MAVRAGGFRLLRPSGQPKLQHVAPQTQKTQVAIAEAHLERRGMRVKTEVDRCLGDVSGVPLRFKYASCLFSLHNACENRQHVGLLGKGVLGWSVRKQSSGRIPIQGTNRGAQLRRLFPVEGCHCRRAHLSFDVCSPVEGQQQLQIQRSGVAFVRIRRSAPRPGPIYKIPPGQTPQRSRWLLPFHEELQDRAHPFQVALHEGGILHMHPVIMEHAYPPQAEWGDVLLEFRGRAAIGEAFGGAGGIDAVNRLARKTGISGSVIGNQCLDACVAHVLKLFVVRAIHIRFVRTKAGRAPSHLQNFGEFLLGNRIAGAQGGAVRKGIGHKGARNILDGHRVVCGLDAQLYVAPGAPPERPVHAIGTSLQNKFIVVAHEVAALHHSPVALAATAVRGLLVESLGITNPHPSSFTSRYQ